MKKAILILFIIVSSLLYANNPDSLFSLWENKSEPDSSRIIALAKFITFNVINTSPDSAKSLNDELYLFSEIKKNDVGMSEAYNNYAILSSYNGNYKKALDYLGKGLEINKKMKSKVRITNSLTNIAFMYTYLGDYDKAMEYNERCLKIQKELNDKQGIIKTYNNMGIIYDNIGNNKKAIENYELTIKLSKEIAYQEGIGNGHLNIALIYYDLEEMEKALVNINQSLEIAKKLKDKFYLADTYSNVGYIKAGMNNYDDALEYYNKALKLHIELNDIKGIANVMFLLGELSKNQGDFKQALWYFSESLESYEEIEQSYDISACYMNIGKCYLKLSEIRKAIDNCEKGYTISNSIGAIEIEKDACDCLYESYRTKGNDKKAIEYMEISNKLLDSINNKETTEKLAELEYENKTLADSLVLEKTRVEKKLKENNNVKNLLFLGSGMLVLLIAGGYFIKRRKS